MRGQLPVTATLAYLNTGTGGPLPICAVEAIDEGLPDYPPLVRDTHARLAALIGADPDEVALTDSTTHGVNTVVSATRFEDGAFFHPAIED